jgi:hypothetical protein
MIELDITPEIIRKAKTIYNFRNLKTSFTNGKSQLYGAIGEILFQEYYNIPELSNTYDYDVIFKGKKIDIKTKKTGVKPLPIYNCSVALSSFKQKTDGYFFVRIMNDYSKGYLLGYTSKKDFFNYGHFYLKGEKDIVSNDGFNFKVDCFNLTINDLSLKKNPLHLDIQDYLLNFDYVLMEDGDIIIYRKNDTLIEFNCQTNEIDIDAPDLKYKTIINKKIELSKLLTYIY